MLSIHAIRSWDAKAWEHLRQAPGPGHDHWPEIARFYPGDLGEPQSVLVAHDVFGPLAILGLPLRQ